MNKKIAFLFPLMILAPFAFASIGSNPAVIANAYQEETKGECLGYTYTQKGINRYYDSTDFGPNIIKTFWAPSGYKFSVEITDEQLDLMFDQAEAAGINYRQVNFITSYTKFGMEVSCEAYVYFGFSGREECREWIKNNLNSAEPFYEIENATAETDITFNIEFYFTVNDVNITSREYSFFFKSETMVIEPFDASEFIDYSATYYDNGERIVVQAFPVEGFFDESLDGSGLGFKTRGSSVTYDYWTGEYKNAANYTMKLFVNGVHEVKDITDGWMEMSPPTHPLTMSVKLEFEAKFLISSDNNGEEENGEEQQEEYRYEHYVIWSKEFIIGDPEFRVTIDDNPDRTTVQQGTKHKYDLDYINYNNVEDVDLGVSSYASPLRLKGSNVIEHYEYAIGPETLNYYVAGIFNFWGHSSDYIMEKVTDNHFVLHNLYAEADDDIYIDDDAGHQYYNSTTYEGCYYTLGTDGTSYVTETGYYDVDLYPQSTTGNYFTLTKVEPPQESHVGDSNFYLTGYGDGFYNVLMNDFRFYTDPDNNNHFILKNALLIPSYNLYVKDSTYQGYASYGVYVNASTYDNCGYTLVERQGNPYISVNERGLYDVHFYLDAEDGNYITFVPKNYYLVGTFNNWTPSKSCSLSLKDKNTLHYSDLELKAGDVLKIADDDGNIYTNVDEWQCCGFTVDTNGIVVNESGKYNIDFHVKSSQNIHIVLNSVVLPDYPELGEEKYLQYVASPYEVRLHDEDRDEEFLEEVAGGTYYIWDIESNSYTEYEGLYLIERDGGLMHGDYVTDGDEESLGSSGRVDEYPIFDYVGKWAINLNVYGNIGQQQFNYYGSDQVLDVSPGGETDVEILLNVPDESNLFIGGDDIEINARLSYVDPDVDYYYDWQVTGKEGVVNVSKGNNGKIIVSPTSVGVTSLTVKIDSKLFATIEKTISVRVLDAIYDVAKIKVPDEFHQAGKALTASISVRGFIGIQNVDIEWTATTKDGTELKLGKDFTKSGDQSITITNPKSDDYTLVASYEGVKLDKLTVQVRLTDLNKFLRVNVWWIFLMTIGLVVFMLFIKRIFRRGRTTVENIEKVYQVFCQCLSDDKLTLAELKTIKREISKCLHRCETLNIEALNQYEKAIRYLRKSLIDTNSLIKKWETITVEDKSTFTEKLNLDLSKALNVAREIENAKELIEQYHVKANRQNYEVISDEPIAK